MRADGAPVERLLDVSDRPLVSVFLPTASNLSKGHRRCDARTWISSWPRCGRPEPGRAALTRSRLHNATR